MAECGDSTYDLIDFVNANDLQNSVLFSAQIDSINRATSKASISLVNACDALESLDLTEVEFFYHCESSTGTVEDLAFGHLAFNVGDIVYCIFSPANGNAEQRLYIIGHVDIKFTKTCAREYLIITIPYGFDLMGNPVYYYTIVDVGSKSILDLATFISQDITAPGPVSFPAAYDDAALSWINANFVNPSASPVAVTLQVRPVYSERVITEHASQPGEEPNTTVTNFTSEVDPTRYGIRTLYNIDPVYVGIPGLPSYVSTTFTSKYNQQFKSGSNNYRYEYYDALNDTSINIYLEAESSIAHDYRWTRGIWNEILDSSLDVSFSLTCKATKLDASEVTFRSKSTRFIGHVSTADALVSIPYNGGYGESYYTEIRRIGSAEGSLQSPLYWTLAGNDSKGIVTDPVLVLPPYPSASVALGSKGIYSLSKLSYNIYITEAPKYCVAVVPGSLQGAGPYDLDNTGYFECTYMSIATATLFEDIPHLENYVDNLPVSVHFQYQDSELVSLLEQVGNDLTTYAVEHRQEGYDDYIVKSAAFIVYARHLKSSL